MAGGVSRTVLPPALRRQACSEAPANRVFGDRRVVLHGAAAVVRGGSTGALPFVREGEPACRTTARGGGARDARPLDRGSAAPGEPPVVADVPGRRYACRACGAVLVVVPRGRRAGPSLPLDIRSPPAAPSASVGATSPGPMRVNAGRLHPLT